MDSIVAIIIDQVILFVVRLMLFTTSVESS